MNKLKALLYLDHRPVQVFLATLWLLYGTVLLLQSTPFVEHPIDNSDIIPPKIEGLILIGIAFLGYLGAVRKSLKTDLVFSIFSLYKNVIATSTILLSTGFNHSWWINEFVQAGAAALLVNKAMFNIRLEKYKKSGV